MVKEKITTFIKIETLTYKNSCFGLEYGFQYRYLKFFGSQE